jgi:hypothetical protein
LDASNIARIDNANFTVSPTAPTPIASDNSTKVATTAFVKNAVNNTEYIPTS